MNYDAIWGQENAGVLWAVTIGSMLVGFLLWIFLQWRIFSKAGFSGALALINLGVFVPVIGPLIVVGLQAWFAFTEWPIHKPRPHDA